MMKPYHLILIATLVNAQVPAAERVALVIGNDAYQHARPLNAAVSDATAVAATLQKLGFETISASNAGFEQMVEAMETLKAKAVGAQAVLVYYAGHGIEAQGVNYLIPTDAKLDKEVQLRTQALNLTSMLDDLAGMKIPARMIILDCCRDNPLEGRSWLATRSAGGGGLGALPEEELQEATLVVYAASPGKPALDRVNDTDEHSPFTQALLDELPQPGVHSFEVFGRIEERVLTMTDARQKPRIFYNGSTLPFRNFRFVAGTAGNLPAINTPPPMTVIQAPPAPASATEGAGLTLGDIFDSTGYDLFSDRSKRSIISKAQDRLRNAGAYHGKTDGTPGPQMREAILSWQKEQKIEPTGRLDGVTLSRLALLDEKDAGDAPPTTAPKKSTASGGSSPKRSGSSNSSVRQAIELQYQRGTITRQQYENAIRNL
jgi:hypothetical protein